MLRRMLAMLLALVLVVGMIPTPAYAAEEESTAKTEVSHVDRSALGTAIDDSHELLDGNYTPESLATLEAALTDAEAVFYREEATQEEADAALAVLLDAVGALEEAEESSENEEPSEDEEPSEEPAENETDTTDLMAAIAEAIELNEADYTPESWAALIDALVAACEVPEDADQETVDAAWLTLVGAIAALEEAQETESSETESAEEEEDGLDALEEEEDQPQRQLFTVMLDESAPYSSPFDPNASVVVTVEGHTLSHGFYIEPTVVSFDEFVSYWADRGVTVAKEDITAGGMIDYVLYAKGFGRDGHPEPEVYGAGYMSGADGIRKGKGDAKVPACLADDGITITQVEGDDLYEFDYSSGGGWMFTEGNWLSNQAMAGHEFSQCGTVHYVNGQGYYVVRLQFTIAGLGADLGFVDWGNSFGYVAADKSDLYIYYATLNADDEAKEKALDVMTQLDATQEEVDAAAEALWNAAHAEVPEFIVNLDKEPAIYGIGEAAEPLVVEAEVSVGDLSYAWYSSTNMKNWTELPCTDSVYTPSTDRAGTVYYKCIVTNNDGTGMGSVAESNVATVICGAQTPVFTRDLSTDEVSYLTTDVAAPLVVEAVVSDGGSVVYQWYQSTDKENWFPIPDMDGRSYTPVVTEVGTTYYKCTATNCIGRDSSTADSAIAKVTVRVDTPVFDTDLRTTTYYIQLDERYTLSVEASIRDGGALSYQWYSGNSSAGGVDSMTPIDGATEASYTVTDTNQPGYTYYRVKVTNTLGSETAEAVSNWTAVSVKVCSPSFDTDLPRDEQIYTLKDENAAPMTVEAILDDWNLKGELKGTISYQWYTCEDEWGGGKQPIEGAVSASFTPDVSASGYKYYCCEAINTVENSKGEVFTASDDSRTATVRVIGSEIPQITTDLPSSMEYTLEQADAKLLTVEVEPVTDGGTLSYQWYQKAGDGYCPGIDYMQPIDGANRASYMPDLSVGGTNSYACRVTNTLGDQATFTDSRACKVTVNCADPVITKDLEAETLTYVEGDAGKTLTVEAESTDGGELRYQWYNGTNAIAGATESSFTIPTNEPGSYSYCVEVTNAKSGAVRSVKSAVVTVKITAIQKEISTEEELRNMRPNGSYILTNDIELTQKWNPINNFSGILDGNGHTISKVSVPEGAGFFTATQAGAEIRNLSLNGRISRAGSGDIGGLIGKVEGDTVVSNCHVDIAVIGEKTNNAGGIVGNASGKCLIENSYYTGVLRGNAESWAYAGGIIGNKNNGVTIKNCYTTHDKVAGTYGWYGTDASTMVNCYSALGDQYTSAIPEDLTTFHELLGEAYVADTANINRGYPILQWEYVPTDKTALNEAIEAASALSEVNYTAESWAPFAAALAEAQDIAAQEDPAQADVDAAWEALIAAMAVLELDKDYVIKTMLDSISANFTDTGSDWEAVAMAAYGMADKIDVELLKENAEKYIFAYDPNSTNYERLAISCTAAGINAGQFPRADGSTTDLIAEIANMESLGTINGYIFALNAYDCGNYTLPADAKWTRDAVIDYILEKQLADGGWALFGSASDPDITGMTVTALSLYRERADVSAALDRALSWMSESQLPNGGYKGAGLWGVENSNSSSMVIVALAAMDIDADKDERFIKNGKSVLDALLAYRTEDDRFGYRGPVYDGNGPMATEQGFRALVAYSNWLNGEGPCYVYDFGDTLSTISVSFRLVGDEKHGEEHAHTNYMTWIPTEKVKVSRDGMVSDVFKEVLAANGMEYQETQPGYIGMIQAPAQLGGYWLGEFDNGTGSGWMYTVNGVHPGSSLMAYPVHDQDVIVWHYVDDFTNDDGSWLTVPDTAPVKPEAVAAVEERIAAIGTPVTLESREAIEAARKAFDALTAGQQQMVANLADLEAAEEALAGLVKPKTELYEIYKETAAYQKTLTPGAGLSVGGEWIVLGLARSEFNDLSERYINDYYAKVEQLRFADGNRLHKVKSSENARVIVTLAAIGKDPTQVAGHDLIAGLNDMTYITKQGLNGPIWALIALDTKQFEPSGITRKDLIGCILDRQRGDGGWSLMDNATSSDVDVTGMALYALAPYADEMGDVKTAVDKALDYLSREQTENGGFISGSEGENLESCVQVIVALSTLGIDADEDERFVKNGNSLIDAFLTFYKGGGQFAHTNGGARDPMSTEQALYAMAAYYRNQNGQNALYDMGEEAITKPVNKAQLEQAIAEAEQENKDDYTEGKWKAFTEVLKDAKAVMEDKNATQARVDYAAQALRDAIDRLHAAEADKRALRESIAEAEALKEADYTEASWKRLQDSLKRANEVDQDAAADQETVDNARTLLDLALKLMKKAADKKDLKAAIDKAKALKAASYTQETWGELKSKLDDAEEVYEDGNAVQADADAAEKALTAAIAGLKKATGSSGGGTTSKGGSTSNKTSSSTAASTARAKLDAEVKKAEQLKKEDYTEDSWKTFETALKAAQDTLKKSNATSTQLTNAYTKLAAAEKTLKKVGETLEESRKKLETEAKEGEKLVEADYTAETWKPFADALAEAKKVLAMENPTAKELDEAYARLATARIGLEKFVDYRSKLEDLVEKCGGLVESSYTAESWASFQEALDSAKEALKDDNTDQKQLGELLDNLNAAGRSLVPATAQNQGGMSLIWWIPLIVLVLVLGGGAAYALLKKKKM